MLFRSALARELKQMEQEMEAQRREAEAEVVSHKSVEKTEAATVDFKNLEQQVQQLGANMDAVREQEQRVFSAMEELNGRLDELRHELNSGLNELHKEIPTDPAADGGDVSDKLEEIREELSEKIHTESVKCYRNVQSLVEETKEELLEAGRKKDGDPGLKGPLTGAIVLGTVNLVLLVVLGLLELGVFDFLM